MKASIGVSAGPVRVSQGLGLGGGIGGLLLFIGPVWVIMHWELLGHLATLAILLVVAVIVITGLVSGIANDIRRYRSRS